MRPEELVTCCYAKRMKYMKARKKTVKNTIIIIVIVTMIVNLFFGISFDSREVMAAYSFETSIKGFPDSYKPYLRNLHKKYPKWKFVPIIQVLILILQWKMN